jgi:hypothetical protein
MMSVGLLSSIAIRPSQPGTYILQDGYDLLTSLCASLILTNGVAMLRYGAIATTGLAWGVAVVLTGALAALTLVDVRPALVPEHLRSPLFSISNLCVASAVGILILASLAEAARFRAERREIEITVEEMLATGAQAWTTSLVILGLLVQSFASFLAWGAFWSWDPLELWRLSLGLVCVLVVHSRRRESPAGARRAIGLLVALAFSLFVLFGAGPLVRVLGLPSQFVS